MNGPWSLEELQRRMQASIRAIDHGLTAASLRRVELAQVAGLLLEPVKPRHCVCSACEQRKAGDLNGTQGQEAQQG